MKTFAEEYAKRLEEDERWREKVQKRREDEARAREDILARQGITKEEMEGRMRVGSYMSAHPGAYKKLLEVIDEEEFNERNRF